MPFIDSQLENTGLFVQQTPGFDVQQLLSADVNTQEFKDLLGRLYEHVNSIAIALNLKDSGYFLNQEFNTGKQFFNPLSTSTLDLKPIFRKVIDFGPLSAGGPKAIPHGIPFDGNYSLITAYAGATDPIAVTFLPIPFASAIDIPHDIQLTIDAVFVVITNGFNYSNYTRTYVTLEYIKY